MGDEALETKEFSLTLPKAHDNNLWIPGIV